ncbi:PREDICTED: adenosine deaminase CECR1-like [Papilio polytes]|uniref:adenosine deaminase CECR1-like n=1 Tax=Papilio polytes TaxID=76194 RepID=UPI0006766F54|nr:PREDICTED: adenosine deaminase CECR1-like [Papilio polytes]
MAFVSTTSVLFMLFILTSAKSIPNYIENRINLIESEVDMQLGSDVILNDDEKQANEILMHWKQKEIEESFRNPQHFNFSKHYFAYKNDIPKSKVYQIIKRMPKGAVLHVHSSLMLSADRLLNLTYEEHLYMCNDDGDLQFRFSEDTPKSPCSIDWVLLKDLRNLNGAKFDESLKEYLTLFSESDSVCSKTNDINSIWRKFEKVSNLVSQLIIYRPVTEKFFYEALIEFYEDNIQYIEIRSGLKTLYELNGTVHDKLYMPRLYREVAERFKRDHPDFVGVKLIVTRHRLKTDEEIRKTINMARQVKQELPSFFAGFDLVGQEDLGRPLSDILPFLAEAKNDLQYYFHGGETNWYGTSADENLFDAVLLGSKRIGHAYGLIKHPSLLMAVKQKDIALEVNVVSNVVLGLVHDVRNHPLATYLALGLPVVLSSDDPGVWGADPLSHDFYITFVGVASKRADLRLLKQLAINSIKYSTLNIQHKEILFRVFYSKWDVFIKQVLTMSATL